MAFLKADYFPGTAIRRLGRTDENISQHGRVDVWTICLFLCIALLISSLPTAACAQPANVQSPIPQSLPQQNQGLEELPAPPELTPGATGNPMPVAANQPAFAPPNDTSVRIIDVVSIAGDMSNDVQGIGLVMGLAQTGGRSLVTAKMAENFFLTNGLPVPQIITQNMSAVTITGQIPPHMRVGETFSVNVATADDATSLFGGDLQRSVLRGIDNEIYAIAQGPVIAGGLAAGGAAADVQKDHPTSGTCEATIVREVCSNRLKTCFKVGLLLRNKDYVTAVRIANKINEFFPQSAHAVDSGAIEVLVPETFIYNSTAFISMIGELRIIPSTRARVVISQKTGTIVLGANVRISKVLFANENLIITTSESPQVAQPAPFSRGRTTVVPRTQVQVFESGGTYNVVNEGVTVGELANALNALRVPPSDLIQLFKTLRDTGAIQAEVIFK